MSAQSQRKLPTLPDTWKWTTVGEITEVIRGASPRPKGDPRYFGGSIPWIMIADLSRQPGKYLFGTREHVTEAGAAKSRRIPAGSLILSNSATVCVPKILKVEGCIHDGFVAFPTLKDNASLDFAYYWFEYVRPTLIQENRQGITQVNLNTGIVRDIHFPLPPLADQLRIVAEIEKQFTRLEAGVAALKRVQANLKRYRAAVLKAACEGKLVPTEAELARAEGRTYEKAAKMIARTAVPERPNRWNSRSKDILLGHSALAVGNPQTTLPEGWAWTALVEIAKMESGHTPSRLHPEWWDGDIDWIGLVDARLNDGRTIHDTLQHTNSQGLANSAARLLPEGTVCISRTASVGYVVVMGKPMATSQDFVNWVPTSAVMSDWLRIIFSADRDALRRFGKGSVHNTIYFPEWLSVHVALPPLAEQKRIVEEVERRLSVLEEMETAVQANLLRATRLRQAVLQRAFSGELAD